MASSYFVLNKKDISFYYVLRRVVDIFFIIVGWVLVYSICQLIVKHRFIFLEELKGTAFYNDFKQSFLSFLVFLGINFYAYNFTFIMVYIT